MIIYSFDLMRGYEQGSLPSHLPLRFWQARQARDLECLREEEEEEGTNSIQIIVKI